MAAAQGNDDAKELSASSSIEAIQKRIEKVSNETIDFLVTRPWWDKTFDALQVITVELVPNTHVVAHHDPISMVCAKLLCGSSEKVYQTFVSDSKDVIIKKGTPGDCHNNLRRLLQKNIVDRWLIGFALSDDGLWRHHSWGLMKNGQLMETTKVRLIYLGVDVDRLPAVAE